MEPEGLLQCSHAFVTESCPGPDGSTPQLISSRYYTLIFPSIHAYVSTNRFPNSVRVFHLPMRTKCPAHFILDFINLINNMASDGKHRLRSSSLYYNVYHVSVLPSLVSTYSAQHTLLTASQSLFFLQGRKRSLIPRTKKAKVVPVPN
jgi:hypothetical protein